MIPDLSPLVPPEALFELLRQIKPSSQALAEFKARLKIQQHQARQIAQKAHTKFRQQTDKRATWQACQKGLVRAQQVQQTALANLSKEAQPAVHQALLNQLADIQQYIDTLAQELTMLPEADLLQTWLKAAQHTQQAQWLGQLLEVVATYELQ